MQLNLIKHKWKIILCLLFVFISTCALAACTYKFDPADKGNTVTVIYDANGGNFSNVDITKRIFRYKPSVSIVEPGGKQNLQITAPVMDSHHVSGWYVAALNEDGTPKKNAEGEYLAADGSLLFDGTPWDFSKDRLPAEDGSTVYLIAHWAMNFTVTIDVGEDARADGVQDIVRTNYSEVGPITQPGIDPEWDGHTLFQYYYKVSDSEELVLRTAEDWAKVIISEENPDIVINIRWLEGEWNVVREAADLSVISARENYILDADIDMNGTSFSFDTPFRGIFDGNGHTISNFVTVSASMLSKNTEYGLFSFAADGYMKNITFKDATYSVTVYQAIAAEDTNYTVGFMCADGSSLDLSKFENIGFMNCTLIFDRRSNAKNENVVTGTGSYAGIFGVLGEDQSFTPAEGSTPVTVKLLLEGIEA